MTVTSASSGHVSGDDGRKNGTSSNDGSVALDERPFESPPGQHVLPQAYLDEEPLTPYEPIGVTPDYLPPRGAVDPDKSKGWIRRVWPMMLWLLCVQAAGHLIGFVAGPGDSPRHVS